MEGYGVGVQVAMVDYRQQHEYCTLLILGRSVMPANPSLFFNLASLPIHVFLMIIFYLLAIDNTPAPVCFNSVEISSSKCPLL